MDAHCRGFCPLRTTALSTSLACAPPLPKEKHLTFPGHSTSSTIRFVFPCMRELTRCGCCFSAPSWLCHFCLPSHLRLPEIAIPARLGSKALISFGTCRNSTFAVLTLIPSTGSEHNPLSAPNYPNTFTYIRFPTTLCLAIFSN